MGQYFIPGEIEFYKIRRNPMPNEFNGLESIFTPAAKASLELIVTDPAFVLVLEYSALNISGIVNSKKNLFEILYAIPGVT